MRDAASLRRRAHAVLLRSAGARQVDIDAISRVVQELDPLLQDAAVAAVAKEVMADLVGMGPFEPFLRGEGVTDVMVVKGDQLWIERDGVVERAHVDLQVDDVVRFVERVVAPLGLRVDRASPMLDARLPDGARLNVILPPLAIDGPCVTIRRFPARRLALPSLVPPPIAGYLLECLAERRNVVVSGRTGSGKTTLLGAMLSSLAPSERVITIEDPAELQVDGPHVVRLESRRPNSDGIGEVTVRDLVRNALRMRPDRLVVGEVRGAEALDMLQAMSTGHDGSLSTCHARSAHDAVRRIETMALMSDVDLPLQAVQRQIAASIDVVVQMDRDDDGRRIVVDLANVEPDGHGAVRVRSIFAGVLAGAAHA